MALKPCRECGAQVSTEAEVCPHCGVHSPAATDPLAALAPSGNKQGKISGFGWFTLVLVGGIIVLFVFFSNEVPKETTCDSDWRKCADNEQLVNNYSRWTNVKVECKREADGQARYKTDWPWLPFGTFLKGNEYVTSGTAIAIEPDAQFQNGFGAMVRSRVTCTYDLRAQRVISVDISAR